MKPIAVTDYKVIYGVSAAGISNEVNKHIAKGYQLYGPLVASGSGDDVGVWQTLVLPVGAPQLP